MVKLYEIAAETIGFQNKDPFVDKAVAVLEKLYKEVEAGVYKTNKDILQKCDEAKEFLDLIRKRFNINIEYAVEFSESQPAAIFPARDFYFNEERRNLDNPANLNFNKLKNIFSFLTDFKKLVQEYNEIVGHLKTNVAIKENKTGYIDYKQAKAHGYLADMKHFLCLNYMYLINSVKFTPKELLSVVLHEIGHGFTSLEYYTRVEKLNFIVSDILQDINNNRIDKAIYKYRANFSEEEFFKDITSKENIIRDFPPAIAKVYIKEFKAQLNKIYIYSNREALADNFAVKFNLGIDLADALHKIHKSQNYYVYNNFISIYCTLFFYYNWILLLIYSGPIGLIAALILVYFLAFRLHERNFLYDEPKDRFERIKLIIVQNLKNTNLDEELKKDLIEQFRSIEAIHNAIIIFPNLAKSLFNIITIHNREAMYYKNINREVENLLNNTLFVKSAELSLKSS